MIRDNSKCILCRRCSAICEKVQGIRCHWCQHARLCHLYRLRLRHGPGRDLLCLLRPSVSQSAQPVPSRRNPRWTRFWQPSQIRKSMSSYRPLRLYARRSGREFGYPIGTNVQGKMAAALRRIGFDKVFDTNFQCRLNHYGRDSLNSWTVCRTAVCFRSSPPAPGWIKYCEHYFPDMTENLSRLQIAAADVRCHLQNPTMQRR